MCAHAFLPPRPAWVWLSCEVRCPCRVYCGVGVGFGFCVGSFWDAIHFCRTRSVTCGPSAAGTRIRILATRWSFRVDLARPGRVWRNAPCLVRVGRGRARGVDLWVCDVSNMRACPLPSPPSLHALTHYGPFHVVHRRAREWPRAPGGARRSSLIARRDRSCASFARPCPPPVHAGCAAPSLYRACELTAALLTSWHGLERPDGSFCASVGRASTSWV